ncbi:unnamed protein product [Trypanosoma congolense IL3000]|uniref:WGS project CAEQ00000000 data, annotated contig 104 n=1 Tax=Trypanosoma congolense (strain IL3000) TaxID=1068625 RepID=F9W3F4_TRYCI|nr:unnamed protein product [Trypanosoma congolense IL3000]
MWNSCDKYFPPLLLNILRPHVVRSGLSSCIASGDEGTPPWVFLFCTPPRTAGYAALPHARDPLKQLRVWTRVARHIATYEWPALQPCRLQLQYAPLLPVQNPWCQHPLHESYGVPTLPWALAFPHHLIQPRKFSFPNASRVCGRALPYVLYFG